MKFEEKIKNKFLYDKNFNSFKFLYFSFQYFKSKFKPRIINSNWGVDVIVESILRNKNKGVYIDVGCHHPLINNNTYLLNRKGWSGINIDLDFNAIDMFNYFRPNDDNQLIALSDKKGIAKLYFFHNRAPKNTLDYRSGTGAKKIQKVETNTLNNVIKKSKLKIREIDFLSIDVEGNEMNVLKGLNFKKYRPKVICVELIIKKNNHFYKQKIEAIQKSIIYKFLIKKNYKLSNWIHDDLIFVSNDFIKKK